MMKLLVFISLAVLYIFYSFLVYTNGTQSRIQLTTAEQEKADLGKKLYQQYNCTSCHQLYGLGGYLGPDLTTAWSDPNRGRDYIKVFLKNGGPRMPNFNFSDEQTNAIISYLSYIDKTAITYKSR